MQKSHLINWLLMGLIILVTVGNLGQIMTTLNRNEHMYVAASVLIAADYTLYQEFAYLQTPYLPLFYGNLYNLLRLDAYYLLLGKLISFLALNVAALTLFLLARRVARDQVLALAMVALFVLNASIVNPAREVSNYIIPVALSMLAFYLFETAWEAQEARARSGRLAMVGFLLALTVGVKLTYAGAVWPFALVLLLYPIWSGENVKQVVKQAILPFALGFVLGSLPLLFYLLTDPTLFIFNNWGYHSVNTEWRNLMNYTAPMAAGDKLAFARETLLRTDNLVVVLAILLGMALAVERVMALSWRSLTQWGRGSLLAVLLLVAAIPMTLMPTPSFRQYYAVPVSFLFLLLPYVYGKTTAVFPAHLRHSILLLLVLVSFIYNSELLYNSVNDLRARENWVGLTIPDEAQRLHQILAERGQAGPVATLSPLFAIEANLPIYPELATGSFLYRVGDLLTPEERARFVGSSPESIPALLAEKPPAAILVGFDPDLDNPLVGFAVSQGYEEMRFEGFRGVLFVRR